MVPKIALLSFCMAAACTTLSARPPHHRSPLPPVAFNDFRKTPRLGPPVGRVVLVHGFMETGSSWRHLERRLRKAGYECIVPRLKPKDGRGGLERLAKGLKTDIDNAFGPDTPITLIGFSMGGLVSRYYLQSLGGASRCQKLFTISSPHQGTQTAFLYPSKGAVQMRPGSRFLKNLAATEENLGKIPVVSYRTPLDLMILPAANSIWSRAENVKFTVLAHPMMLTSRSVINDLEQRIRE